MYGTVHIRNSNCADCVIGIVASAGGVSAVSCFLSCLPIGFPAPILIAQHLARNQKSSLLQVLQRSTHLPIVWAGDGMEISGGTVYLVPPDQYVSVDGGRILTSNAADGERSRQVGNVLLRSLAHAYGPSALAIVLTGCLSDGATGSRAVSDQGGKVFVQAPASCDYADMPMASLKTGAVDFALPTRILAAAVTAFTMAPGARSLFTVSEEYRRMVAAEHLGFSEWAILDYSRSEPAGV